MAQRSRLPHEENPNAAGKWLSPLKNTKKAKRALNSLKNSTRATVFSALVQPGQTVNVQTTAGEEYYTKISYSEYVNAHTGEIVGSRQIMDGVVANHWRIIDRREMANKLNSVGMLNSAAKHIEVDIETSMGFNRVNPNMRDVYQLAWAEIDTQNGNLGQRVKVARWDVLKKNIPIIRKGNKQAIDWNQFEEVLTNKRVQQNWINEFTNKSNVSDAVAKDYIRTMRDIKKYAAFDPNKEAALLSSIQDKGYFDFKSATNTTTVVGTVEGIPKYMRGTLRSWSRQLQAGELSAAAFNAPAIDQSVINMMAKLSGMRKNILSLGDSRGTSLLLRAMQHPEFGADFYMNNQYWMNTQLDKLGIAGGVRETIMDNVIRGMSSAQTKGTDVESLYNILQGLYGKKYVAESHAAMSDVMMTADLLKGHTNLTKKMVSGAADAMGGVSTRKMLQAETVKQIIWKSIQGTSVGQEFTGPHAGADFSNFFDKVTKKQLIKNTVETMTMESANRQYAANIFQDTRAQFGGGTLNHLLMGAFAGGLVTWAVNKARAQWAESKRSEPDGLSHNSLPTIIRRLQMTDFGSVRSSGNATTAAFSVFKAIFDETRQRGLGKSISNLLGGITAYIKHGLRIQDVKDIAKTKTQIASASKRIGSTFVDTVFGKESRWGAVIKEKVSDTARLASDTVKKIKDFDYNKLTVRELSRNVVEKYRAIDPSTRLLIGGALGVGVGGAMLMNAMKGSNDPYYTTDQYTSADQHKPRNYQQNLRSVRSVRHAKNIMETRFTQQESPHRYASRRMHSDFGSGVLPISSTMKVMKSTQNWGVLRRSFKWLKTNVLKMGKGVEKVDPSRVFKNKEGISHVIGPVRSRLNVKGLATSVDRAASVAASKEASDIRRAITTLAAEAPPEKLNIGRRLVRPFQMIKNKLTAAQNKLLDKITPMSSDMMRNSQVPTPPMRNFGNYSAKISSTPPVINTYDKLGQTFKSSVSVDGYFGVSSPNKHIRSAAQVLKAPKQVKRELARADLKAAGLASRHNMGLIRSMADDATSTGMKAKDKSLAKVVDYADQIGSEAMQKDFISKGDMANFNMLMAKESVPKGYRPIKSLDRTTKRARSIMSGIWEDKSKRLSADMLGTPRKGYKEYSLAKVPNIDSMFADQDLVLRY